MADGRKGWGLGAKIGLGVIGLLILLAIWGLFFARKSQTNGPVSLEKAKACPIPLPPTARNVQHATWTHFHLFEEYVRFEAPVDDCKAHVQVVFDEWRKTFSDPGHREPDPLTEMRSRPLPVKSAQLDLCWFDVHNIRNGLVGGGGGSGRPMIWIDLDQGIFYYRLTD